MGDDVDFKLIGCFRKRKALWRRGEPLHHDKVFKMQLWEEIAEEMGMPSENCIQKMNSLRRKHNKQMLKAFHSQAMGAVYKPTWVHFKELQFLEDQYQPRKRTMANKENGTAKRIKHELDMLKLIQCFKDRALLWDYNNPKHGVRKEMNAAWEEVGKEMGEAREECRKKMYALITKLRHERSKMKKGNENENGKALVTEWFALKSLSFLDDQKPSPKSKVKKIKPKCKGTSKKRSYEDDWTSEDDSISRSDISDSSDDEEEEMEQDWDPPEPIQNHVFAIQNISDFSVNTLQTPNPNQSFTQEIIQQNIMEDGGFSQEIEAAIEIYVQRNVVENERFSQEMEAEIENDVERNVVESFHGNAREDENNYNSPQSIISPGEDAQCRSFGVFIGNKLKMYPKSTRNMVLNALNNIIFSADEGYLEPKEYKVTKYKLHK